MTSEKHREDLCVAYREAIHRTLGGFEKKLDKLETTMNDNKRDTDKKIDAATQRSIKAFQVTGIGLGIIISVIQILLYLRGN